MSTPPPRPPPPPLPTPGRRPLPPRPAPEQRAPTTTPTLGRAGPYELILELAAGGMAMVFLAYATDGRADSPLVAVKRPHRHLASDKTFLSMLLDEARLASLIQHPNVVKVRELGFHVGEPFIVMDYVEGASLAELRKELATGERALDTRIAVRIALDALAGLHAAHELRDERGKLLGIIHRDVSPHNVLIGSDGRSRLTDFGIAKAEDRLQTTRTHEVKGKLAYLAPERIDRRRMCTKQSDVFSMGVVLWECIAGRRLFRGEEAIDTLNEVMSAPIPRLRQIGAHVPPALDDVIARSLSRDLDERFQTAADFAGAVERAAGPSNIATPEAVGRVVEAIFGGRLGARHEEIRGALGDATLATRIFEASGLPSRAKPTGPSTASNIALLTSVAPPAPSERYSFGKGFAEDYAQRQAKRTRWGIASGVALGIGIGAVLTLIIASRPPSHVTASEASRASATPSAQGTSGPVRRLVVALPFVATRVTLDDIDRDVVPASDVVAFDVPADSEVNHRVVALGIDGTRAEGTVREDNGVARVDAEGFVLSAASPPPPAPRPLSGPAPRSASRPGSPSPVEAVRNGFTKLR